MGLGFTRAQVVAVTARTVTKMIVLDTVLLRRLPGSHGQVGREGIGGIDRQQAFNPEALTGHGLQCRGLESLEIVVAKTVDRNQYHGALRRGATAGTVAQQQQQTQADLDPGNSTPRNMPGTFSQ